MRVEEIISWRAADAVRAARVAADEPEELLANLPKIIEALLGLDTSQAATGWLNQQAEPPTMLNPKLAVELQASSSGCSRPTASARSSRGCSPSTGRPLGAGGAPAPVYNFFTSQLTAAAVRALEVGQPGLMPAIFANLLPPGRCTTRGPSSRSPRRSRCRRRPAAARRRRRRSPPPSSAPPQDREAQAWEYFLFCFLKWPLADRGEAARNSARNFGAQLIRRAIRRAQSF